MRKPEKPKPPDDAAQSARFLATAKEAEADETGAAFDAALGVIAPAKVAGKTPAKMPTRKKPTG